MFFEQTKARQKLQLGSIRELEVFRSHLLSLGQKRAIAERLTASIEAATVGPAEYSKSFATNVNRR